MLMSAVLSASIFPVEEAEVGELKPFSTADNSGKCNT